jgi:hypothetical protein
MVAASSSARRLADEHGERLEWRESDQLKLHHDGHPQRKLLKSFVRFSRTGSVHDEHDAVPCNG